MVFTGYINFVTSLYQPFCQVQFFTSTLINCVAVLCQDAQQLWKAAPSALTHSHVSAAVFLALPRHPRQVLVTTPISPPPAMVAAHPQGSGAGGGDGLQPPEWVVPVEAFEPRHMIRDSPPMPDLGHPQSSPTSGDEDDGGGPEAHHHYGGGGGGGSAAAATEAEDQAKVLTVVPPFCLPSWNVREVVTQLLTNYVDQVGLGRCLLPLWPPRTPSGGLLSFPDKRCIHSLSICTQLEGEVFTLFVAFVYCEVVTEADAAAMSPL